MAEDEAAHSPVLPYTNRYRSGLLKSMHASKRPADVVVTLLEPTRNPIDASVTAARDVRPCLGDPATSWMQPPSGRQLL
ncbi:uncharacterized protein KRP23_11228 [Phytophthora ramorum]|uniref:uncharacterized protein n=1 Tax=Phytophthora ramorum TaxID=164328 RepID=UPI0030B0AFCB|nr:hypothetical protein KRP23_11228 [Phytophthora ramorum]